MPVQRRHRSTIACQECRSRKVRCSVTVTGIPCARCAQDGAECVVQDGPHNLPHSSLSSVGASGMRSSHDSNNSTTARDHAPEASSQSIPVSQQIRASSTRRHTSTPHQSDPERQRELDEEQHGVEISVATRDQGNTVTDSDVPYYTGERPGVSSIDFYSQPQQAAPKHLLLRPSPPISISQCDRDYLTQKGVFNLPQESSRREFLRAYFHNVHPILPVIDVRILENLHGSAYMELPDLLLFWSMATVAVNFVPSSVWQLEGFQSRKDMRDTIYGYAKCLYNNGGAMSKECHLQSALLLCFWYSDRDSHSQLWYWSGVAISLCQIIGLHRDPGSSRTNPSVTPQRRRIWRRIWGACLFRDRWLSLTLGRPMRIRLEDCNMPFPTVDDVLGDVADLVSELREIYLPRDLSRLVEYWMVLLHLSRVLGDVLTLCYQQKGPPPSLQQCENLEAELLQCHIPGIDHSGSSLEAFYHYHTQLHYQTTLITFYRPFISTAPRDLEPASEVSWRNNIRSRMEAAAASTNATLDSIAREELVGFVGPMTPPLLVPAMNVHLLNCKSTDSLVRKLGFNKLEFCMAFMRELQKTYSSASIFCGIFGDATRQLTTGSSDRSGISASPVANASSTQVDDTNTGIILDPTNTEGMVLDDNFLESLLDENFTYNLWGSTNALGQEET